MTYLILPNILAGRLSPVAALRIRSSSVADDNG